MSEKLGTCGKWGEPHERVVIFAPQLDLNIENHYCNWQPLPTPSETPSEPVLAYSPLCGDIYPVNRSVEHCTCGHESGHAGKHKCWGCSFEWESPNPITAMAGPENAPTLSCDGNGACKECRGTGLKPRGWEESFREAATLRAALTEANGKLEAVKALVDEGFKASVRPPQNHHYIGTLIDLRAALTEAVIEGGK